MRRFLQLVSEETGGPLETLARQSQQLTRRHFGKTMRLFAPLYVSNECVNNCSYCGFSRDNGIFRVTLTVDRMSAPYIQGATIDFVDTIEKQGFTIDNPNASGSCACGDSFN